MSRIALTFDDGPDRHWTPVILDALAAEDIQATFFVIASRALAHPELIAQLRAEGHSVQLHCDEHVRHSERDRMSVAVDTDRALSELAALGVEPTHWRPPAGDRAPFTARLAAERGLHLVGWTADTNDWRGDIAEDMLAAIVPDLSDGAIVLAHDAVGPGAQRSGCAETARLIGLVAGWAHDHDRTFDTIGRLDSQPVGA